MICWRKYTKNLISWISGSASDLKKALTHDISSYKQWLLFSLLLLLLLPSCCLPCVQLKACYMYAGVLSCVACVCTDCGHAILHVPWVDERRKVIAVSASSYPAVNVCDCCLTLHLSFQRLFASHAFLCWMFLHSAFLRLMFGFVYIVFHFDATCMA